MQVDAEIGFGNAGQRLAGDPFGLGGVAHPVQGLGEPADQTVVLRRARR